MERKIKRERERNIVTKEEASRVKKEREYWKKENIYVYYIYYQNYFCVDKRKKCWVAKGRKTFKKDKNVKKKIV